MNALMKTVKILSVTFFVMYVVLPCIIYVFPQIHRTFLFMHFAALNQLIFCSAKWPYTNYTNPQSLGVNFSSRNFYLETDKSVKVGVWQVLPKSLNNTPMQTDTDYERALSEYNHPIVVYLHGNTWTRSAPHRIHLYNVLAESDHHVLTLDYRGYGDSTGTPCEPGVTHDAITLYKWAKQRAGSNPVFLWGHSLGTAIATFAAKDLCKEGHCPPGLVLESPFNNLIEVIRFHPLTAMFSWLPYFDKFMIEPIQRIKLNFTTDDRIQLVDCPILIMHAKDDRVIPFALASKLNNAAVKSGRDVTFIEFDSKFSYGHKYICSAPELPHIIYEFFQKCHPR